MADKAQFEACKAAASESRAQIESAPTREDALALAISVAENLMKALRLTSSPEEKKDLKSQCSQIMDLADRIKRSQEWIPKPARTKKDDINQWAAEVAKSAGPAAGYEQMDASSAAAKMLDLAVNTQTPSGASSTPTPTTVIESQTACDPNAGHYPYTHDHVATTVLPITTKAPESPHCDNLQSHKSMAAPPPVPQPTNSYSHVRTLAEPISTRKRAKREEIILLRASIVNGFKCPPWDSNPAASEFALHDDADLFTDVRELSLSAYQQQFFCSWVRARHALPPVAKTLQDKDDWSSPKSPSHPIDLVQDAATDCSVVASLCAGVARAERGHDQILSTKIYPFDKHAGKPVMSANGKYLVRLNFNGCWRKVVIDDRLPASGNHRRLYVVDRHDPTLLWPALLEKSYLKVRGGYDFPGSNSCSDLWTLTGWIPEQIYLQETDTIPHQLWHRLYNSFLYGDVLVTLGTGKMSTRQERELGLEGQHSYVVLDMKETEDERMLLVKNPWVEGRGWSGARSAGDASTSNAKPDPRTARSTTFWIGLEQTIQHFESLYLNWNPGLFRHRQDVHFEWTIDDSQTAGGCIVRHPQFSFWSKGADIVWFLLSRHFRDAPDHTKGDSDVFNDGSIRPESLLSSSGEAPMGYMSIYVCDGHGNRIYIKDAYLESTPYVTTPQCLLRWDTDAKDTYTVVVDQEDLPPSPYTFTLSAFSNTAISLEPATQKYPFQKEVKGEWTRQTAGGSTSSPKYFENPQWTVQVRERSSLAILLTSTHQSNPLHVKLALGYGKRIYRLQSRDVLVDSGDHRSGCVFAETRDLQPGLYTVICSLFEAGQTGDYTLRVDSTSDVALKPIARDGAGLLPIKLAPACFGPQVQKVAAPLVVHRLASYTIIARFLRATSPRSRDLGMLARSPLRLSVELGRGPERKFLITSEGGEYADTATVRSESVNLDPDLLPQGDLWLVLDRLSGPGQAVEEWYEVEMFTDVPKACSLGVWRDWSD